MELYYFKPEVVLFYLAKIWSKHRNQWIIKMWRRYPRFGRKYKIINFYDKFKLWWQNDYVLAKKSQRYLFIAEN